jgi:hypothetical protein
VFAEIVVCVNWKKVSGAVLHKDILLSIQHAKGSHGALALIQRLGVAWNWQIIGQSLGALMMLWLSSVCATYFSLLLVQSGPDDELR